ncbi:hypothetical protein M758_1G124000 [Ceratodon purpureus]|nr:hypothetical protein M758_1G124000 [Ceratodon purpureus]
MYPFERSSPTKTSRSRKNSREKGWSTHLVSPAAVETPAPKQPAVANPQRRKIGREAETAARGKGQNKDFKSRNMEGENQGPENSSQVEKQRGRISRIDVVKER